MMPCVCAICGARFDRSRQPSGTYILQAARECPDCGGATCPRCHSHEVYDMAIVMVPPQYAASVRASVEGRVH